MNRIYAGCTVAAAVLVIVAAVSACTSPPVVDGSPYRPVRVDLPKGLVFPDGQAVAYRVAGKPGAVIRSAELSIRPLVSSGVKAPAGFQVYEQVGNTYLPIASRERGDRLITDMFAGKTYLVAPVSLGALRSSLTTLCRFTIEPHRPVTDIPSICTKILCGNEPFTAGSLEQAFGALPNGVASSLELGGGLPRDLCQTCTRPHGDTNEEATFRVVCPDPPGSPCNEGRVLFADDFEAEAVGSAPSASPAGPPPDDQVTVAGDVTVVDARTRAVLLRRGNDTPAEFKGHLGAGATATGSYCVQFSGSANASRYAPVIIAFEAGSGARAWQLIVGNDEVTLYSGGGQVVIPGNFRDLRNFRFTVNLDRQRFDMFVDDNLAASGMQLLHAAFDVPSRLRASIGPCILECFTTEFTLDDIRVTKTE